MNKEEIKKLYFYYMCDLSSLCRDQGIVTEDTLNTIEENETKWTQEYLEIQKKSVFEATSSKDFSDAFIHYLIACKTYEDLYKLTLILKDFIIQGKIIDDDIFIFYYKVIISEKKRFGDKERTQHKNLIEYYRFNDINKYNMLVKDFNEVLNKDTKDINLENINTRYYRDKIIAYIKENS